MKPEVYSSSSLKPKRKRRTKNQLNEILEASRRVIEEENGAITIRHLFYRLVGEKLIGKTEREYSNLGRYLMNWRRAESLPWSAFADNTRWYYGNVGFSGMEAALLNTRDTYRRNLWASQRAFVEIWAEKDAIASILLDEADSFGVRVFPLRGYASGTALYNAACIFKAQAKAGKEIFIYYFGDHDPRGTDIDRSAVENLRNDHGVDIHFERVAVLPDHIKQYDLPTRPPKKKDTLTAKFKGEAVEIDAMHMNVLREMVRECIIRHIEPQEWAAQMAIEKQERQMLNTFVNAIANRAES